jgi:hypothetical protein
MIKAGELGRERFRTHEEVPELVPQKIEVPEQAPVEPKKVPVPVRTS